MRVFLSDISINTPINKIFIPTQVHCQRLGQEVR